MTWNKTKFYFFSRTVSNSNISKSTLITYHAKQWVFHPQRKMAEGTCFLSVFSTQNLLNAVNAHLFGWFWSCFQLGKSLIHQDLSPETFTIHVFHMFRSMWFCCNLPWVPARWWCATFPGHRWWKKRHGFYTMPGFLGNVQKASLTEFNNDTTVWTSMN